MGGYIACSCGKHRDSDKIVIIEKQALLKVPGILQDKGWKKAFIISDIKTYRIAGNEVKNLLKKDGIAYSKYIFRSNILVSDEINLGRIFIEFDSEAAVIIGIGSGTIADITRFVAGKFNRPYILVATTAAMDGYCSSVATLRISALQNEFLSKPPYAVIFDMDILNNAPAVMAYSGFGEVISKYTAVCDWKLGHLLTDEYYCESTSETMVKSVNNCIKEYGSGEDLDSQPLEVLTETLSDLGKAMSHTQSSRPCSGSEHEIALFWEMRLSEGGKPQIPYGLRVAYASMIVIEICNRLLAKKINWEECGVYADIFDSKKYAINIKKTYRNPQIAKDIIENDFFVNTNNSYYIKKRIAQYKNEWDYIKAIIIQCIPKITLYSDLLLKAGISVNPESIGIDKETFVSSILYSKELRSRFSVLRIANDLGFLEDFTNKIVKIYYR